MAKTKTKTAAFVARVDKMIGALKEGPRAEHLRISIREGLLAPGAGAHDRRGGLLKLVFHLVALAEINAKGPEGQLQVEAGIMEAYEPESALVYLAEAAEQLERLLDAVGAELDQAEADNARRRSRAA